MVKMAWDALCQHAGASHPMGTCSVHSLRGITEAKPEKPQLFPFVFSFVALVKLQW